MLASLTHLCYPSKWESNYLRTYRCLAYDNFQFILLEEINCTLKINKLVIVIAPCPQMVIITAPIKGFLPKIKGGNCHIPISQNTSFIRLYESLRGCTCLLVNMCIIDDKKNVQKRNSFLSKFNSQRQRYTYTLRIISNLLASRWTPLFFIRCWKCSRTIGQLPTYFPRVGPIYALKMSYILLYSRTWL